jgi:ABC-type thiamine transport system substrate-binding protein
MSIISIARFCAAFFAAVALATAKANAAEIGGALIAKAKQEGEVVYYTDLIVDQIVRPLASAFEAKYGIKVSYARADSQVNILKMLNELKAGRVMSDIFGLNTGLEVLIAAGAARQFTAANGEELPARYRDPDRYAPLRHHAGPQHGSGARRPASPQLRRSAGAVLEGQDGVEAQ